MCGTRKPLPPLLPLQSTSAPENDKERAKNLPCRVAINCKNVSVWYVAAHSWQISCHGIYDRLSYRHAQRDEAFAGLDLHTWWRLPENVTATYVWHDTFIHDMTHAYVWHDVFIHNVWRDASIHVTPPCLHHFVGTHVTSFLYLSLPCSRIVSPASSLLLSRSPPPLQVLPYPQHISLPISDSTTDCIQQTWDTDRQAEEASVDPMQF